MSCSELKAPETLIETDSIDAQTGELLHREIDEDLLVLRSEDLDLGDVRDAEEL